MSLSSSPRFSLKKFMINIFHFRNWCFYFKIFFYFQYFSKDIHCDRWRHYFALLSQHVLLILNVKYNSRFCNNMKEKKHRTYSGCSYTINLQYSVISLTVNKMTLFFFICLSFTLCNLAIAPFEILHQKYAILHKYSSTFHFTRHFL